MSRGALEVIKPGLLTTIQDLGRYGHQAVGVPVAGPMDAFSHRLANQLVGNTPEAATPSVKVTPTTIAPSAVSVHTGRCGVVNDTMAPLAVSTAFVPDTRK